MKVRILIPLLLCLLVGCAPIIGTYFSPSADEGDVKGVGGYYAPRALYLSRGDGVTVIIDGGLYDEDPQRNKAIVIQLWLRNKSQLHLPLTGIHVISEESTTLATIASCQGSGIGQNNGGPVSTSESIFSADQFVSIYGSEYFVRFEFSAPKPDVFYVELPAMRSGGKDFPSTRIKFVKTQGWWIQPLL